MTPKVRIYERQIKSNIVDLQQTCLGNILNFSFFKKQAIPTSFPFVFDSSNKHYNFTANKCEKCPSTIWCWDSNPRPSEYESPPITTRPGLPPNRFDNVQCSFSLSKWQMQYLRSQLVSIRLIYMASPLGNKESEKQTDFIQKYHNLFLRNSQKVNSIQSYNSGQGYGKLLLEMKDNLLVTQF